MVDLRPATADDLDALVALHLDTVSVAYRDFFPTEAALPSAEALGRLWAADLATGHAVLVAVDDNTVVGSVVARAGGSVARLHVHPTWWRQGIGRRLLTAAVDALRDEGDASIELWVIEGNEPARTLYERSGWRFDPSRQLVELGVVEVRYTLDR